MTCSDLGLLDDALNYGKRAHEISKRIRFDPFLFLFSLRAIGWAFIFKGDCRKMNELGNLVLEYGERQSDPRALTSGHNLIGTGHYFGGNIPLAIETLKRGILISPDPLISCAAKTVLGGSYFLSGNMEEAGKYFAEVHNFCEKHGAGSLGVFARGGLISICLVKGELGRGVRMEDELIRWCDENENKYRLAFYLCRSGKIYSSMARKKGSTNLSFLVKNLGFIMRNTLVAGRKAEEHLKKCVEVARQIGAIGILGQASLELGLLYKTKGKTDEAKRHFSEAIEAFEKSGAEGYLKQAREALAT